MPFPDPIVALFRWQGARQPLPTAPPPFPLPGPNDHADIGRQISETMLPRLLILGSTTPYRGTQVVTLVMPPGYPQPILLLDIRLTTLDASATRVGAIPHLLLCVNAARTGHPSVGFPQKRTLAIHILQLRTTELTYHLLQRHRQNWALLLCSDQR